LNSAPTLTSHSGNTRVNPGATSSGPRAAAASGEGNPAWVSYLILAGVSAAVVLALWLIIQVAG
jgi:hypothetical protein